MAELYPFRAGLTLENNPGLLVLRTLGAGTDPRGGRHFDQLKQAGIYHPDGLFTPEWDGHHSKQRRYINDAADWPLDIRVP